MKLKVVFEKFLIAQAAKYPSHRDENDIHTAAEILVELCKNSSLNFRTSNYPPNEILDLHLFNYYTMEDHISTTKPYLVLDELQSCSGVVTHEAHS